MRALQAQGQFKVRALTRRPGKHRGLADEVVEADLDRPGNPQGRICRGPWRVSGHQFLGTRHRRAQAGNGGGTCCQGSRRQTLYLVNAARCGSDQRRQVPRSPLYRQGQDRSDCEGSRVCTSYVRHRALSTTRTLWALSAPQKQADGSLGWAASSRSHSARHSHGRHYANSATSLPEHSHTRTRQAMASICPSSVIS